MLAHILQQLPYFDELLLDCFILGVMKNLKVFSRLNSLQIPELEVFDCVFQIFINFQSFVS